jgi:hypothetical protein
LYGGGVAIVGGPLSNVYVSATKNRDLSSQTTGSNYYVSGYTKSNGYFTANNVVIPANWHIDIVDSRSQDPKGSSTNVDISESGYTVGVLCITAVTPEFVFTPSPLDIGQAPTATITGSGIATAHGMPTVEFHDVAGNIVGTRTAQWVSSDGTQLTVGTDVMWNQRDDSYSVVVKNRLADGTLAIVGAARFDAIDGNNDVDLCSINRLYC